MGNAVNERGLRLIATLKALSDLTDSENGVSAGELRDAVAQKASEYAGHPIDRPDKRTTWRDVETLKNAGLRRRARSGDQGEVFSELEFRAMGAQVPRRCDKNVQVSHGKPGESHNREAQSHGAHRRQRQVEPKAAGPAALSERHVQADGVRLGANRARPEQGMEDII